MPHNPARRSQGGDVEGETKIDVSLGDAISVAEASFDPGYDLSTSMHFVKKADLLQGYCTYGRAVGEDPFEDWNRASLRGKGEKL